VTWIPGCIPGGIYLGGFQLLDSTLQQQNKGGRSVLTWKRGVVKRLRLCERRRVENLIIRSCDPIMGSSKGRD